MRRAIVIEIMKGIAYKRRRNTTVKEMGKNIEIIRKLAVTWFALKSKNYE